MAGRFEKMDAITAFALIDSMAAATKTAEMLSDSMGLTRLTSSSLRDIQPHINAGGPLPWSSGPVIVKLSRDIRKQQPIDQIGVARGEASAKKACVTHGVRVLEAPGSPIARPAVHQRAPQRAAKAVAKAIAIALASTEKMNMANIRMSLPDAINNLGRLIKMAKKDGLDARAYISTALGCPYEGNVPTETVINLADKMFELGADKIAIADTIGSGGPALVEEVVGKAAKKFGATHAVNISREKSTKAVYGITEGRGADYVFVTVGDKNAIEQGFKILGRGGTLVIVGMTADGVKVEFDSCKFAGIEQNMLGSKMGSTRLVRDIPWYISMYQQGRLKLDELITGRYPLEEINKAIADVRRSDTLRNVIVF